jgi:hypothetical protein
VINGKHFAIAGIDAGRNDIVIGAQRRQRIRRRLWIIEINGRRAVVPGRKLIVS